ncbi:MAG TPA: hypothetical protein VNM91_02605 [Dehalococcoidia bacterium]|nr:hypothetical protein [Dehalococcoidia bacterium]
MQDEQTGRSISQTPAAKPKKGARGPIPVSDDTRTNPEEGAAENAWRHRAGDERNFDQEGRQRHGTSPLVKYGETRSPEEKSASIDLDVTEVDPVD